VIVERPRREWLVHLDAATGAVLEKWDNLAHATGRALVFDPNPVTAVADWRIQNISSEKIKKDGTSTPELRFEANPDILAEVAALTAGPWCVGFAAETEKLSEFAHAKRLRKGIPMLIGNLAQHVMDAEHTTVTIFDDQGEHALPMGTKQDVAQQLIHVIAQRFKQSHSLR
jgi:phosphopantothenoylcysteine decarboxylase/phosphopantothenate--cysteine ligase